jgi:hypothetical protein
MKQSKHFSQTVGAGSQISSITHEYIAKPAPTDFGMRLQESCEKSGVSRNAPKGLVKVRYAVANWTIYLFKNPI